MFKILISKLFRISNLDIRYYLEFSILCLGFTIALFSFAQSADAATYYVATTGSDSNAGTITAPFRTIGRALTAVGFGTGVGAGKTVFVGNGTYAETFSQMPSGASGNPFTLKSQNPLGAVIMPNTTSAQIMYFGSGINQYTVVDGFVFDGLNVSANNIYISRGTNDITFQNVELKNIRVGDGSGPGSFQGFYNESDRIKLLNSTVHDVGGTATKYNHAIYWQGSDGIIEGNTVYNVAGFGIHLYSQHAWVPSNNIVRKNTVHDFGRGGYAYGILLSYGSSNIAYNNLVYHGRSKGIVGGPSSKIYNNTVYDIYDPANADGTGIWSPDASGIVRNNIVYQVVTGDLINCPSGSACDHNFTSNPNFVNAGANDFHLQSTSPAINTGATLSEVTTDHDGVFRPQGGAYDIGAYEYVSGTSSSLLGDINRDKIVNSLDWSLMSAKWLTNDATADLNEDGVVNSLDWSIMSSNWLKTE